MIRGQWHMVGHGTILVGCKGYQATPHRLRIQISEVSQGAMLIRKGVKLLEEREGQGDLVQCQHEYILAIRLTLKKGEILVPTPVSFRPNPSSRQRDDGFFEHRTRVNRSEMIPGLFYGIQGMKIGGYRKVAISPHLAYGDKGIPDWIPPQRCPDR